MTLAEQLVTVRHGISFEYCLLALSNHKEFVSNYDKLRGTNLSMRGSGLDLQIDISTGRLDAEVAQFVQDCWDTVFSRF